MSTFIHVADLTRFNDGTIAARDFLTPTIRVFSPDGHFLRAIGRQGGGPGEFTRMTWFGDRADSIVAYDDTYPRLTWFSHDGTLLSTTTLTGATQREGVIGRLRDGTWITLGVHEGAIDKPVAGNRRPPNYLSAFVGSTRKAIADVPGLMVNPAIGRVVPFGPNTTVAVSDSLIWIGDNATNIVRAVDLSGREVHRIQLPWPAFPVSVALRDQLKREGLERARSAEAKQMLAQDFASPDLPPNTPYYNAIFVAKDGNIWVEGYTLGHRGPASYLIYQPNGTLLAHVEGPAGLRVKDAGPDWVLGIHYDPDEVETIQLYQLTR